MNLNILAAVIVSVGIGVGLASENVIVVLLNTLVLCYNLHRLEVEKF